MQRTLLVAGAVVPPLPQHSTCEMESSSGGLKSLSAARFNAKAAVRLLLPVRGEDSPSLGGGTCYPAHPRTCGRARVRNPLVQLAAGGEGVSHPRQLWHIAAPVADGLHIVIGAEEGQRVLQHDGIGILRSTSRWGRSAVRGRAKFGLRQSQALVHAAMCNPCQLAPCRAPGSRAR